MTNQRHLIIDIIPLTRLPSKANDSFYYFSNQKIKKGSIVEIEFKKRRIFGYIKNIFPLAKKRLYLKEEKIYLKPVLRVINEKPPIFPSQIKLAEWLKNYANLSLATAFSYFFPYKLLFFFNLEKDKEISEKNKGEKILIIVPQESYLDYLKEKYPEAEIISSRLSSKKLEEIIKKVIYQSQGIFIGTKNAIFLPWNNLKTLIIYHEGSIFYKDFFKPPYLDYRKIFLKFAEINKVKLKIKDTFPSFEYILKNNQIPKISFDFERINEKEAEEKIFQFKKNILFFPEKLMARKLVCENCFQNLICQDCNQNLVFDGKDIFCFYCLKKYSQPSFCPSCNKKAKFFLLRKGGKAYFEYLSKIKKNVFFLENENKKIIRNFTEEKEGILIGSLALMNPMLSADAFFFFNFDEFYYSDDSFLKEKFIRVLNFFKNKVKKIFLVSEIINPLIEKKLKEGNIVDHLLEERKINNLPPYKRLIVLKSGSTDINKIQRKLLEIKKKIKEDFKELEIIGPIFARPFKVKKRYFLELVLRIEPSLNFNLRKILKDIDIEEIDVDAVSF